MIDNTIDIKNDVLFLFCDYVFYYVAKPNERYRAKDIYERYKSECNFTFTEFCKELKANVKFGYLDQNSKGYRITELGKTTKQWEVVEDEFINGPIFEEDE